MNCTETRVYKSDLEPVLKEIGEYLKIRRSEAGITQAKLAQESGIGAHMNIARYENGNARIPLENIAPIAKVLRINPVELAAKVLPTYGMDFLIPFIDWKAYKPKKSAP